MALTNAAAPETTGAARSIVSRAFVYGDKSIIPFDALMFIALSKNKAAWLLDDKPWSRFQVCCHNFDMSVSTLP